MSAHAPLAMTCGRYALALIFVVVDLPCQAIGSAEQLSRECICKVPQPCSCAAMLELVSCFEEEDNPGSCKYQGHDVSEICQVSQSQCSNIELACEEKHAICSSGMVSLSNVPAQELIVAAEIKPNQAKDHAPKNPPRNPSKKIVAGVMPDEAKEITYNNYLPNWEAFLAKPDEKAFAVGELKKKLKSRPWASVWNHATQHAANFAAVVACERMAPKCRVAWPLREAGQGNSVWTVRPGGKGKAAKDLIT